jgi:hypothetical protein
LSSLLNFHHLKILGSSRVGLDENFEGDMVEHRVELVVGNIVEVD